MYTKAIAEAAISFCEPCPVRSQCLSYAQEWRLDGVWGGQLLQDGVTRMRRIRNTSPSAMIMDEVGNGS